MKLRAVSRVGFWPAIEDLNAFLPTSAWRENRASIAGMVSEDLFAQLILAYAELEQERARFVAANKLPPKTPLTARVAEPMGDFSNHLGHLRRQLGVGGGWPDEIDAAAKELGEVLRK